MKYENKTNVITIKYFCTEILTKETNMDAIYLCIIIFLGLLAIFDLTVGVSNDAVNFLNSAIGAKAARFRTIIIVASCGILIGAVMSNGMMDIARHGIMQPSGYSFHEVMTIFLAVMVTDIVIIDIFNTLGLPTSTTVSLVFELLGGTFIVALLKISGDATGNLGFVDLLNTEKALSVIIAIFLSVAIAFVFGTVVQWISRIIFTFNYKKHLRYTIAIFGGIAFTSLGYFIFIKGMIDAPFDFIKGKIAWINQNITMVLIYTFIISAVLVQILHWLRVNVFKVIVLLGTFALAMAFAGNDLVNFIGVPLAGLSSYQDFMANGNGNYDSFMMSSLMDSAKTPVFFLVTAGIIMIIAMTTSKKAQNVVKTSVDLARQDEGEDMFGSSRAARSIVRLTQSTGSSMLSIVPRSTIKWIDSRFNKDEIDMEEGASFDMVRAAVNLVLAGMLIIMGTSLKLPLSTTYVTFMVAMGSSLADRAWGRESAVFRITGVLSVIGGWFLTAGSAFIICAIVCFLMYFGGFPAMTLFIVLDIYILYKSNKKYNKKVKDEKKDDVFRLMMRSRDPEIVWDLLNKHVSRTQSFVTRFALEQYKNILDALANEDIHKLRQSQNDLNEEHDILKKYRKKELLAMRRIPTDIAIERNTWFHLGANSNQQFIYCLKRMLDPIKEHVDNNFNPLPKAYIDEFQPTRQHIEELMTRTESIISTNRYDTYKDVLAEADTCKDDLSALRKQHIDRMQRESSNKNLQISLVYLNILQESQEFLSIMRHQLRAARKFLKD